MGGRHAVVSVWRYTLAGNFKETLSKTTFKFKSDIREVFQKVQKEIRENKFKSIYMIPVLDYILREYMIHNAVRNLFRL
jgi:hypothetical protein